MPSATQCAAVRIRSPAAECSTPPVHVCSEPPPRNTAPTLGSGGTGAAVGGVLGATVAACSTGGWFAHAAVTRGQRDEQSRCQDGRPAAEKRMSTDLASTLRARRSDRCSPAAAAWATFCRQFECARQSGTRARMRRSLARVRRSVGRRAHCEMRDTRCQEARQNADTEQHYQPEQTGMYELEFPAPQLSSADGSGPVMIHALEGFSDAGHAIRLAAAAPEEHSGHRAGGVVRHRRTAGLPVATAADDVQDRPLHPLRGTRAEPVRPARQRRNAVSAARGHGAGPALGAVHHRGAAAGRTARRSPDDRPGHHPDGGAAHPSDHDDGALQRQGADRRSHAVGR